MRKAVIHQRISNDPRVRHLFSKSLNHAIIARHVDADVEVSANVSWGGKDGPKGDISMSGTVRDKDDKWSTSITYNVNTQGEQSVSTRGTITSKEPDSVDNTSQDLR